MTDFFHGWRRKVGCVKLVLAAVLVCGWSRSQKTYDWVEVNEMGCRFAVESAVGIVRLVGTTPITPSSFVEYHTGDVTNLAGVKRNDNGVLKYEPPNSEGAWFEWYVFRLSDLTIMRDSLPFRSQSFDICYGAVTIPLSLLSAWLILLPGKRNDRHRGADSRTRHIP